ncbi:hypothetical protein [Mesorhizobium sp. Mes31]|uniref:hypothetical protein n=1 Tax=Mesorhizobium sp. Mes31 TaxID=2926017 RepID=UPI002119A33A|nr:hypothetical protein [Mesorhizobium sp. Mes31]
MARNQPKKAKGRLEIQAESPAFNRPALRGVDRRTAGGRRYAEILDSILAAIGGTVRDEQMILARRAASIALVCESEDARLANGEVIDGTAYVTLANALSRLFESLGIDSARPPSDRPERVPPLRIFG